MPVARRSLADLPKRVARFLVERSRGAAGFVMGALALALVLASQLGLSSDPVPQRTAVVDPALAGPVWRGWGTSLSWWANVVGGLPDPVRAQLCEKVFRDLGLNIVRYEVGAGVSAGCEAMERRARMPCLLRREGDYDWDADANQVWVLRRAKELGADTFEAFACSPPWWMTRSGSVTGAPDGGPNLREESVDAFALHLARVMRHAKESWGVSFQGISPMNEPEADWWKQGGRQAGCRVPAGLDQSKLVLAVDRMMRLQKAPARVAAPDGWSPEATGASWDLLADPARRMVQHVTTHAYGDGAGRESLRKRCARAEKPLWVSEAGDADASGLTLARRIVSDVRQLQPSAWCVWQAVDGGGGWGCIDMDLNAGATEWRMNRKFDVLAQFTRHIRPGARFVAVSDDATVAAVKWDRLVLVTVGGDTEDVLRVDLSKAVPTGEDAHVIRTSAHEAQLDAGTLPVQDGALRIPVPARSVVTVVVPLRPPAESAKPPPASPLPSP